MDKYDEQIACLTLNPARIVDAWALGDCLFQGASHDGEVGPYGCLTMVRTGAWNAATPELTEQIRNDMRIPSNCFGITVESLPVFAEWQRRLDKELGRA